MAFFRFGPSVTQSTPHTLLTDEWLHWWAKFPTYKETIMSEPITSTGAATATVTGVTFIGLLSGLDAGVVVGAFAGAAVFVLSASDFSLFKKLFLFGLSWGTGVLSAPFITSCINFLTPDEVKAAEPVGAMVAGAVVIRLLMWANKESKNPGNIIDRFRSGGGKPDE